MYNQSLVTYYLQHLLFNESYSRDLQELLFFVKNVCIFISVHSSMKLVQLYMISRSKALIYGLVISSTFKLDNHEGWYTQILSITINGAHSFSMPS